MFVKQDYLDYFNEILDVEKEMLRETAHLEEIIENKEAEKIVNHIHKEEEKHNHLVREMISLVNDI